MFKTEILAKAITHSKGEELMMEMKLSGSLRNTPSPRNAAGFSEASWGRRGILFALSSLLLLATPKSSAAATLLNALTSNTNGSANNTCIVPSLVSTFLTTASQVWVYFDMNGAQPGDKVAIKFYRPDGSLYTTLGSNFSVPAPGYVCGSYYITLASADAANYPGSWTIQSFYNSSSTPLFSLNFTVAPVGLLDDVITTANPLSSAGGCPTTAPSSVGTFATSAAQVWVYFDYTGAQVGDTVAVNWYRPDGVLYHTSNSTVSGASGHQCFAYFISLAGAAAASHPGTWTILTYYNENESSGYPTPLFSLNFTVGSAPPLSVEFTEYPIPSTLQGNNPEPFRIAAGPDGAMWFTEQNSSSIGRITTTGVITQYQTPRAGCPWGITGGPDGNVWFDDPCGDSKSPGGYIGRITPAGVIAEFPLPNVNSPLLGEITLGPDRNLWFDASAATLGRVIPVNANTANIMVFAAPSSIGAITAGPDGKLWFTSSDTWTATTANPPVFTEVGPKGNTNLDSPLQITAGPDGALWMTAYQQIQRVTTSGSFSLVQQLPNSLSAAVGIVTGPDGAMWFTDGGANNIGRITTDGKTFNEFPVPTGAANPLSIAAGPDGALWFVEENSAKIGRVTTPAAPPSVPSNGVTDGAGFSAKISGGGIGSIFGTGLSSATAGATTVPLPTTLAGVTVLMSGTPVPLFFVSPLQINFQVPWQLLSSSTATLTVTTAGGMSPTILLNLSVTAPGIFTFNTTNSATQGAIQIANTATFVAPVGAIPGATSRPATTGDVLTIYCSGLGAVTNTPASGSAAGSGSSLSSVQAPVSVTIGGKSAPFLFAGLSPGYVGLYQVNVQFPTGVPSGNAVPVVVTTAGLNSNTATIAVQ
jgi:virginiamycin B lyase